MPIQFYCVSCSRPIEVDDEFAGQRATCPYCRTAIDVPTQSTYLAGAQPVARPLDAGVSGHAAAAPANTLSGGAPIQDRRARLALRTGTLGLFCAATVLICLVVLLGFSFAMMSRFMAENPGVQPTPQELTRFIEKAPPNPAQSVLGIVMGLAGLVGLALSAVSLYSRAGGNWRGWLGLVVCGGCLLCTCGSAVLWIAQAAATPQ